MITSFFYGSGSGIVAVGTSDGKLRKAAYHGKPEHKDEEYAMGLLDFRLVDPPLTAADVVRRSAANPGLVFRQTMFSLDRDSGAKLYQVARTRARRS